MNGQALLDLLKLILSGEGINPTFGLQMINFAKNVFEMRRPWMNLKTIDSSQTVTPATTYTTPIPMPANFRRYLNEGAIVLFDGSNDVVQLTEVPFEMILSYKDDYGKFAVDYANNVIYVLGKIPKNYTVYQYYIKASAAITLTTTWTTTSNFLLEFHPALAYEAAVRWRLGTDYDDVNARNADDNAKMSDMIFEAMATLDNERAIGAVNALNYSGDKYPGIVGGKVGNNFRGRLNGY